MASGQSISRLVRRFRDLGEGEPADQDRTRAPDQIVVEEPLEIRLDGRRVTTTMRTPGHDLELAAGFCLTDGLLAGAPVKGVRQCEVGPSADKANVVNVDTGGRAPIPVARLTTTTSSCGWCGTDEINAVTARLTPVAAAITFTPEVLVAVPERVAPLQELFAATGGVHGAAAFDTTGEVVLVREDIGRHNAVDKVVGRLSLDGSLPASVLGLFVSGRVSFEIVQKAWAGGFGTIVAVSAPSSLAIESAGRAGILLAGFARPGRLNLYVEPERAAAVTKGPRGPRRDRRAG
ncbi:MAG: formate dehydrogenase accessory sulfurtransferase FdhD [Acidimicrobiales bacterium]